MVSETAEVYKKGQLAAHLFRSGNGVVFRYNERYLESKGRPIASTLPLSDAPLVFPGGSTPAFFAGLLPEGRRLVAIKNRIKTSLDNDLALLLEIGADLIGDVQVLPPGGNPKVDRESLDLSLNQEGLSFRKLRDDYFGLKSTGIPGVQDKVSSKMLNARGHAKNLDFILKFNPDEARFAVENEAYFLSLAKKCGIATSKFKLLTDSFGEHALLVQRFDRVVTNTFKESLAVEDGCQVLNLYPVDKYGVDFTVMANKLTSLCAARAVAGYALFRQLVFNWLIGNGDAHAKNFSILQTSRGEWSISPAYDLLCTAYYQDNSMALALKGQDVRWDRPLLVEVGGLLGVPSTLANGVIDKQLTVLAGLPEDILNGALPFRRDENIDVSSFLKKRAKVLATS